jgi:hypothetical protein
LELELGVLQKERKDAVQGAVLRAWLDGKVLPQALVHGITVVTRNTAAFKASGAGDQSMGMIGNAPLVRL